MESWVDLGHLKEPLRLAVLPADSLALNSLHVRRLLNTGGSHGRASFRVACEGDRPGFIRGA